jgi:hypothetical protein
LALDTHRKTTRLTVLRSLDHYYLIRKYLTANIATFEQYPEAVLITRPDAATLRLPTQTPLEAAQTSLAAHHSGLVECLMIVGNASSRQFGSPHNGWQDCAGIGTTYPRLSYSQSRTKAENFENIVPEKRVLYKQLLNHVQANIPLLEQQLTNWAMWSSPRTYSQEWAHQIKQVAYEPLSVGQQFGNGLDQFEVPGATRLSRVISFFAYLLGGIVRFIARILGVVGSNLVLVSISFLFELFNGFDLFGRCFTSSWTFYCCSKFIASWSRDIGNWFGQIGGASPSKFFVEAQQAEEGRTGGGGRDNSRQPEANGAGNPQTATATSLPLSLSQLRVLSKLLTM